MHCHHLNLNVSSPFWYLVCTTIFLHLSVFWRFWYSDRWSSPSLPRPVMPGEEVSISQTVLSPTRPATSLAALQLAQPGAVHHRHLTFPSWSQPTPIVANWVHSATMSPTPASARSQILHFPIIPDWLESPVTWLSLVCWSSSVSWQNKLCIWVENHLITDVCFPILPTAISSPNSSSAPTLSAACLFIHPWSQLLLPTSTQVSGLGSGILLKFDEKCQIWNLIKICQRSCIIFISLQEPGWSNVCTHYPALTITTPSLGKLHYKRCRPYLRLGVCVCVCTVCVFKRLPGWFRKLFYWRIFLVQMGICLILGGVWTLARMVWGTYEVKIEVKMGICLC